MTPSLHVQVPSNPPYLQFCKQLSSVPRGHVQERDICRSEVVEPLGWEFHDNEYLSVCGEEEEGGMHLVSWNYAPQRSKLENVQSSLLQQEELDQGLG